MNKKLNKVLVTGGAGFIGRHIVRQLVDRGRDVVVLDLAEKPPEFDGIEYIRDSVLNIDAVRIAVKNANEVYHLAAIPDLWIKNKDDFYNINTMGTKIVLNEADAANVEKIVYTSSGVVLKNFNNHSKDPIYEESNYPLLKDMPGPYSRSKWLAADEVRKYSQSGVPVITVYPTTPIGPGDYNYTPPTKMIADFLNGAAPAYLDCWLNFVPVEEAALGHILAAEKGVPGERYILSNRNYRMSNFLECIENESGIRMPKHKIPYSVSIITAYVTEFVANHITKKKPIASIEGVRMAGSNLNFTNNMTRARLGIPEYPIEESISKTVKWILENGK
ncbi:MAG: NAD-dependent epimerase/dehydratase family protein [Balneolaceae bacterium]